MQEKAERKMLCSGGSLTKPNNFTPALDVTYVRFLDKTPAFISKARKRKVRGAKAAGNRYERKAQEYLLDLYPEQYIDSPWIEFHRSNGQRAYAQPDGLVFDLAAGHITICEIKLKHTSTAWWQVRQLYEPTLAHYFEGRFTFGACEICSWYEPREKFPERFSFVQLPHDPGRREFGVHIFRG